MINYETLLSAYDDKLTLMQWLKKVEAALKDASATAFEVTNNGDGTLNFSITFEDGSTLESGNVPLLEGDVNILGNLTANSFKGIFEGGVNTEAGKKYKIAACVLRNVNGQWQQIGGDHAPINVSNVVNNSSYIQVTFAFTAKNVVSFVVTPDEKYASLGYFCGSSVAISSANIEIYRDNNAGGYINWTGSAFNCTGDISEASIASNGVITITHRNTGNSLGRSANCRGGVYNAFVNNAGETQDTLLLTDFSGNVITAPDTNFRIFWSNSAKPELVVPADADQLGNLWCFGIFEVE